MAASPSKEGNNRKTIGVLAALAFLLWFLAGFFVLGSGWELHQKPIEQAETQAIAAQM